MKLFIQANDYEDEDSSNKDYDEEMTMFAKRFKRFMRSNKGRQFQKKEGLNNESTKDNDPIICYECKKQGHIKFECPQWKKRGLRKQKLKAHIATWSDEDLSKNEDQEVTSNLSTLNDYSFDEFQYAYDELGLEFEVMMSKHKKNVSKLRNENDLLSKTNHELEEKENLDMHNLLSKAHEDHQNQLELLKSEKAHSNKVLEKGENSKQNFDKNSFNFYKHRGPQNFYKRKIIKSVWVPKGLITSQDRSLISKWIPKGIKIIGTNAYGPKRI
ncbi:hypothetical protein V6Z12_D02G148800 [Gossypium hirsutum]